MDDEFLVVDVTQPHDQLLEQKFSVVFFELSPFPNISQKVASLTQFHDKAHMKSCFKSVVKPDHIIMAALLQYGHFLHYPFLLLFFIPEHLSLYGLDSDQVLTDFMASQVDFAERAPAENAANPIKLKSALLDGVEFLKVESDQFL